jgi:hypothetical protein
MMQFVCSLILLSNLYAFRNPVVINIDGLIISLLLKKIANIAEKIIILNNKSRFEENLQAKFFQNRIQV